MCSLFWGWLSNITLKGGRKKMFGSRIICTFQSDETNLTVDITCNSETPWIPWNDYQVPTGCLTGIPSSLGASLGDGLGCPQKNCGELWQLIPEKILTKTNPGWFASYERCLLRVIFTSHMAGSARCCNLTKRHEREREGEEDEACYWMEGGWWTQRLREIRIKPFLRKHDFQKLKFEGIFWISSKSGFILRCTVIWGKISVVWRPWPTKKQGILIQISSPVKPPCF